MTTDSPLRTRLRAALLEARRARDAETVSTLRTALAALENAEAVPADARAGAIEDAPTGAGAAEAERRLLTDADELAVLDEEIASLHEAGRVLASSAPERARRSGGPPVCWRPCGTPRRETRVVVGVPRSGPPRAGPTVAITRPRQRTSAPISRTKRGMPIPSQSQVARGELVSTEVPSGETHRVHVSPTSRRDGPDRRNVAVRTSSPSDQRSS